MPLRVDSFHISVTEGDCAIHLLVDTNSKSEKHVVKAAVLIDGGRFIGTRDNVTVLGHPVLKTMKWIEDNYQADKPSCRLQLNSIVVTHWDRDHYEGIVSILRKAAADAKGVRNIPWLKWDEKGNPMTHFYCPNKAKIEIPNRFEKPENLLYVNGLDSIGEKYFSVNPATRIIKILLEGNYYEFAQFHSTDSDIWDVLGVDLFRNKPLSTAPTKKLTLPQLIEKHGLSKKTPGLLCIGVAGRNMGDPPSTLSTLLLKDGAVTAVNQSSIAAIVVWPPNGTSRIPRVSHYFAGDLGQTYEEPIQKWLHDGCIEKITSFKANHHGSHFSTTMDFFGRFKPINTFIPSPIDGRHGHPSKLYPSFI